MNERAFLSRALTALSRPVDGASFAVFRIYFGLLVAYEIGFKFKVGKLEELYQPAFHFKYHFFEWVGAPGKAGVYALHFAMILLALLVSAGAFYRIACALLCLLLSYYFLIERTLYINHIYLYCLLAGIMALVPAHNMLSVDERYGWLKQPAAKGRTPVWSIWLLRFQMGIVYTYAGLAKLNPDWLSGSPLDIWLPQRLGKEHWLLSFEHLPLWMSWGGAAFDLCVTPLLLWRKTRILGFVWAVAFHVTNASIFGIASFPWMSLALTTLFFNPSWPRQYLSESVHSKHIQPPKPLGKLGFSALVLYAASQVIIPMRPWFYPGNPSWTEAGHEFSWHMMLRSKVGTPNFYAEFSDGRRIEIDARKYLTRRQLSRIGVLPDLTHQFALFIADELEKTHSERPKVFVELNVSFNGRAPKSLIDPEVDLGSEPRTRVPALYLMPQPAGPPGRGKLAAASED